MLEKLFSSRVRVKLLEIFLTSPTQGYHSRELARITGERQNAIWRELKKLEDLGLLRSKARGNRKDYTVCKEFAFYPEWAHVLQAVDGSRLMLKAKGVKVEQRRQSVDIHERYTMPDCVIACRPDLTIGEND